MDPDQYQSSDGSPGPVLPRSGWRRSLGNLKTFRSLQNPVYRRYFVAMLSQMVALNMQMFARSLLIYRLTGSLTILGGMAAANAVPLLVLSLFGGVLADRFQKKYVVMFGHIASAAASLVVALLLGSGYLSLENEGSWWVLMAASVVQGAVMGLSMPSRESLIREIVPAEQVLNAISLNSMGMHAFRLFGPALTGFIVLTSGFETVYYVMAGSYLVAALLIAILPRTSKASSGRENVITAIKQGFGYLRGETTMIFTIGFFLFAVVLSMPYTMLMPAFADDVLKVGTEGMATLMVFSGIGSVAAALVLASLPNKRRGLMLLGGSLALSLGLVAFAFSESWGLSLGMIIIVGAGQSVQMTMVGALIQYYVDPRYLGRVMSILMMQFGFVNLGIFAAGVLAEGIGVQWAVGGFAIVLVVVTLVMIVFAGRLRRLD
ncbi:MAG: MFS transporter [Dehalococcoidales bacterium]